MVDYYGGATLEVSNLFLFGLGVTKGRHVSQIVSVMLMIM